MVGHAGPARRGARLRRQARAPRLAPPRGTSTGSGSSTTSPSTRVDPIGPRLRARGHDARERPRRRSAAPRRPRPRSRRACRPRPPRGRRAAGAAPCRSARRWTRGISPIPSTGRDVAVVAGHRLGEPAQRAGAQPAEHDARLPRLAQRDVEPVRAQHAHQADHAAAADVDQVLLEQVRAHVVGAAVAAEQRDVRRLAAARREVPVEADDVVVGVAGRGREEAHLRPVAPGRRGQPEHVVVEQRVPRLHREPAAAEGDDLAWARHGAKRTDSSPHRARISCARSSRSWTACRPIGRRPVRSRRDDRAHLARRTTAEDRAHDYARVPARDRPRRLRQRRPGNHGVSMLVRRHGRRAHALHADLLLGVDRGTSRRFAGDQPEVARLLPRGRRLPDRSRADGRPTTTWWCPARGCGRSSRRSASAAPARWRRTAACRRTCRGRGRTAGPGSSPRSRSLSSPPVSSSSCLRYITPAWTLSVADAGSSVPLRRGSAARSPTCPA